MEKTKTTNNFLFIMAKQFMAAVKMLFQSNNNKEFRRLKDFICS